MTTPRNRTFARGPAADCGPIRVALDAGLAAGVLACMIVGSFVDPHGPSGATFGARAPDALSLLLMVLGAAALVFRRRAPMAVLAFTGAVSVVELRHRRPPRPRRHVRRRRPLHRRLPHRPPHHLAGRPAHHDRAHRRPRCSSGPCPGTPRRTSASSPGPAWPPPPATPSAAAAPSSHAIRERAERAERTREEEARRRVAEERLRIARDLHDVVAHHIALVNVQAGVAAHVMDKRPDQAKEALAHVREASRSALNELRATVGLLRQSGDPEAPTEPAPGLDRLDELVDTFRNAGLPRRGRPRRPRHRCPPPSTSPRTGSSRRR